MLPEYICTEIIYIAVVDYDSVWHTVVQWPVFTYTVVHNEASLHPSIRCCCCQCGDVFCVFMRVCERLCSRRPRTHNSRQVSLCWGSIIQVGAAGAVSAAIFQECLHSCNAHNLNLKSTSSEVLWQLGLFISLSYGSSGRLFFVFFLRIFIYLFIYFLPEINLW